MAGALEGDVFIGRKAQEFRGLLKIKYPMEHGIVTDWDDMERIWNWVYAEELGTLSEEVRYLDLGAELCPLTPFMTVTCVLLAYWHIHLASGATHRGAVKPSNEPRIGSANLLRYFQRPRSLHIRTSRFITVRRNSHSPARLELSALSLASRQIRVRSHNRHRSRLGRWRDTRGAGL
jgi:hypothetical protein